MSYKPSTPFSVTAELLIPTSSIVQGVPVKAFPAVGICFNCSFRTFGGTERDENGIYSVEDTAVLETWYRPDIKANCRVKVGDEVYEIIGTPENIEMRNQYLKFKVRHIGGGA